MMNWPDKKRIAVMMAFDLDAETMWTTHGDGSTAHMTNLSRGAYGPKQGVPRILDMLDSHQVKATFFIPGVVAEHYPEVVKEIARRGHDIGFHGYLHEESTKTTYEQEDATMRHSEKIIYDLTGQKIAGNPRPFRSRKGETAFRAKGMLQTASSASLLQRLQGEGRCGKGGPFDKAGRLVCSGIFQQPAYCISLNFV